MVRKLGSLAIILGLALPVMAAGRPGAISGFVKNASGRPQLGAVVELFTSAAGQPVRVFTDMRGYYAAANLDPGTYHIKVSAPSFLPSLRENVLLRSGANLMVNVTLNTLFEAMQLLPARRVTQEDDDWKWTLRSSANRPILRVLDDGPLVVSENNSDDKTLKARVAFMAGSMSEGFGHGSSDMSTRFSVEQSLFSAGTLSLGGSVADTNGPSGVLRAGFSRRMPDGSTPEVSFTVRRFLAPFDDSRSLAAQALTLSASDTFNLMNILELRGGTEFQSVQFLGRATAIRPFGSADLHLGANTLLSYQYATSVPTTRWSKGFDTAPADLTETSPRMTLANARPAIEKARHQEVSISRKFHNTRVQAAAFSDHISNTALMGAGDVPYDGSDLIPDIYSNTFTYNGGAMDTNGLRLVLQQKLNDDLTATVDYSYGGVLDLVGSDVDWVALRSGIHPERRHSLSGKLAGTAPRTHTRWIASYKWTSGTALNPVDMFNSSPGQADPFFNIFLRQPIPGTRFMPGKFEALVDLRNLLAEGYVPVIGPDGKTVYLVQSARSVRGGVAFVF